MEIKINTKSKTITIIGDTTVKELVEFLKSYEDWTVVQNIGLIPIKQSEVSPFNNSLGNIRYTGTTGDPIIKGNITTDTVFNPEKGNWSYTTTLGNDR
jgi:hypothetical protein